MANHVFKFRKETYDLAKLQIAAGAWINGVKPDRRESLGNYTNVSVSWDVQKSQTESNETTIRTVVAERITSIGGTVKMTLQQFSDIVKKVAYSATTKNYTQGAAVAQTKDFTDLKVGQILDTGVIGLTSATLIEGEGEDALEYGVSIDKPSGQVEITSLPDGATGEATLTFAAPAILDAAKKTEYALLQSDVITLDLFLRQLNDGGDLIWLPKVTFSVDGDLVLGKDGTDNRDVTITGTIIADDSQPPGREYGWAIPLADAAA